MSNDTNVIDITLKKALSERYLSYALSTITARSLPDVRDGLKPVHRRLLYAMRQLRLNPEFGFKKCARVVGDVIGKYHPHGDASVYEALVRLAQDFSVRYTLVEGQGNFGNIDGDSPAAMRYTESKLTIAASLLMDGLDENAVDMIPTYDGEDSEPYVMPSAFPNVLANGSTGIAVGMATNIPPHNMSELLDGCLQILKNPDISVDSLCKYIPAPDFPTGGILITPKESIINAYKTGRGKFVTRSKWEVEEQSRGAYKIIVTEIPYLVKKSKLIENIATLLIDKKLPLLADIMDESAEDIRIVLEPRNRSVKPEQLMEQLFSATQLQTSYSMNLNVIDIDQTPKVMPLKDILQSFLTHRQNVLTRRSQFRLDKILYRLEILAGYLIAYKNLDEIIRIIREEDEPKEELIATFSLTDLQADSILNMRLRALRKLEEDKIKTEHEDLSSERKEIESLLASEDMQWACIKDQLSETKKLFSKKTALGKRKTIISDAPDIDFDPNETFIEKEPITVVCSKLGWIRSFKGHDISQDTIKYKDGDEEKFVMNAYTTDKVLILSSTGKFYTVNADKLPHARGHGEPINLIINTEGNEKILHMFIYTKDSKLLLVSQETNKGFIVEENSVIAQTKNGKQVMVNGTPAFCLPVTEDHIAIMGTNRKMLIIPTDTIPIQTKGQGVILQKYKSAKMSDIICLNITESLTWRTNTTLREVKNLDLWLGKRSQIGQTAPHGFPKDNKFFRP